jgi:hypothetical protein
VVRRGSPLNRGFRTPNLRLRRWPVRRGAKPKTNGSFGTGPGGGPMIEPSTKLAPVGSMIDDIRSTVSTFTALQSTNIALRCTRDSGAVKRSARASASAGGRMERMTWPERWPRHRRPASSPPPPSGASAVLGRGATSARESMLAKTVCDGAPHGRALSRRRASNAKRRRLRNC